jgi:hypothetical protein
MKNLKKLHLFALCLFFPLILQGGEWQLKIVADEADVPEKFCTEWRKGDYLLTDGEYLILFGGSSRTMQSLLNYPVADAMGSIIGFAPAGKDLLGNLIAGSPYLRINGKKQTVSYSSIKPMADKNTAGLFTIQAKAIFEGREGERAQVNTQYKIAPHSGIIEISSCLENTGKSPLQETQYFLYFNASQVYSFSPFHWEKHRDLNFRVYPKKGHFLGWVSRNPLPEDEELLPGKLNPGESYDVHYTLFVSTKGTDLLKNIYQMLGVKTEAATVYLKSQEGDLTEIIIQDILSSAVFYRSFLDDPFAVETILPKGFYSVTANFFPAVTEGYLLVERGKENECVIQDPPHGTVRLRVRNSSGEYVPGKVTFMGLDPTPSPYFEPENPIKTGKRWETFKNSCYPEKEGLEVKIPVGTYLVYASRGPEYTMENKVIEVFKDEFQELLFCIDKVVETDHLISVDPHMHTIYSDGRMDIAERIKSVVAEGVEVAVATDHNYINDYQPTLQQLGLDKYLTTIIGNEVTTGGVIHFNTYPLALRADEANNGAIYPDREEAGCLFQDSRTNDPEAILQVNHPRLGTIGYFNNYELDPDSAASARKNFDLSFDVLEVLNGPYLYYENSESIADWLNLLNRGHYFPIVGSSDSHTIDRGEPGYSRTYVFYDDEKGDNLEISSLIRLMKKGRSFASNGPVIGFKVNGTHIPGDSFTAKDGRVRIYVEVKSAPWISVDEVGLIINGRRTIVFPVEGPEDSVIKFSGEISLRLEQDSYIAAEVLGNTSLFPVHQARARHGLLENATLPYALTNPIFVDVDGDGKFDPPLPQEIRMIKASASEKIEDRTE